MAKPTKPTVDKYDPIISFERQREHLAHIQANGGNFYISDCWPWNIKKGCTRLDCPMRFQTIAPEAAPGDYVFECEPAGDVATMLINLKRTNP